MAKTSRTLQEKIADADAKGSRWLAAANEANERGQVARAERLYEKVQYWLDRSNQLRGCA